MGQMEDFRLFTFVVECKGISKAADKLNIAKSAVSRRLNLLEGRFSAKLIDRRPGCWELTDIGRELYQRASRVVNDFEEIETDFKSSHANISGPLAVSVPREFGISFLSEALVDFKDKYPEIQLTVDFDDRLIELDRDNYDFAIRISPNIQDNVIAEKIGITVHHLCAAPSYVECYGSPKELHQLQSHKLLHYGAAKRGKWTFVSKIDQKFDIIEFVPSLNSNSGQFLLNATLSGQGIANLPDFILKDSFKSGALLPILSDHKISNYFIYLGHAEHRRINRRMRLFAQAMKEACISGCS